jgi:hypothetical protein
VPVVLRQRPLLQRLRFLQLHQFLSGMLLRSRLWLPRRGLVLLFRIC